MGGMNCLHHLLVRGEVGTNEYVEVLCYLCIWTHCLAPFATTLLPQAPSCKLVRLTGIEPANDAALEAAAQPLCIRRIYLTSIL